MSRADKKSNRKRVYVSRKKFDVVDEYAKLEGIGAGSHVLNNLMQELIDKEGLPKKKK